VGRKIAIVEDDVDIVELLRHYLMREGYEVEAFYDGESALKAFTKNPPNLVILDLMLPKVDGLEVCRILRKTPATERIPILILTAKGTETDKVVGLELGGDDYITKPFSPRELVARVKALLRRVPLPTSEGLALRFGSLEIYPESYQVLLEGNPIDLTTTEFRLLLLLAQNPGKVFSRERILDFLWEGEKAVYDRTIDFHITRLRAKLTPHSFIHTVR